MSGLALIAFVAFVATQSHRSRSAALPASPADHLPLGSTAPGLHPAPAGRGSFGHPGLHAGHAHRGQLLRLVVPRLQGGLAAFSTLATRTGGRMTIVGVDSNDNSGAAAQTLLSAANATYPVGVDPNATVATSYQIDALPVTYFLDGQGRVVHVSFGTQTLASLEHWWTVTNRAPGPGQHERHPVPGRADGADRAGRSRVPCCPNRNGPPPSRPVRHRSIARPLSGPEASPYPPVRAVGHHRLRRPRVGGPGGRALPRQFRVESVISTPLTTLAGTEPPRRPRPRPPRARRLEPPRRP